MNDVTTQTRSPAVERYLASLQGKDLLIRLDWDQWLGLGAPYDSTAVTRNEVMTRYNRNGFDWDIHGSLFQPAKERDKNIAFVMFHGGAGSENIFDLTPDGRPGLGRVLAAQGFTALAVTYPGHWSPNPGGS